MKENKKKETALEQKIYMTVLFAGILALAGLTVFYAVKSRTTGELVEQNIELGEQNPVSGQVAATESTQMEETTEDAVEGPIENTQARVAASSSEREIVNMYSYNGTDKMPWPVTGNVIIPYSMDTTVYFETLDQYQCNPALYIKAGTGTEVKSSVNGVVTKVEENDRYGKVIVIDMGNGYEVSYGQLSDINLKKGDVVTSGVVVGKIAEPTDYFSLEGAHLYVKMTKDKKPVNPTDYFQP